MFGDADDGLLIDGDPDEFASVHAADDDDDGHWLVCTKCSERRLVPRGQFCTFQKGEVRFFVQVCASELSLDEAQAFGLIRFVMQVGKSCVVLFRVCGGHAM